MVALAGKVLLINGPTSSGKSSIANLLCNSQFGFKKLNTKKIASDILKSHEKSFFSEELSRAAKLTKKTVNNVKTLNYFCENSNNAEIKALHEKTFEKVGLLIETLFRDLYDAFREETMSIISSGYSCVIDHNVFLDPYPFRCNKFFELFSDFGDNFRRLTLYTGMEKIFQNTLSRNHRFMEFAEGFSSWEAAFKKMEEEERRLGHTFLHYRQPVQIVQNWLLHYTLESKFDEKKEFLEKIRRSDLKKLLSQIEDAQKILMGYLIRKQYPIVFSKSFHKFVNIKDQLAFLSSIPASEYIYVYNKRFCHDYLIKNFHFNKDILNRRDLIETPLEILLPWLKNSNSSNRCVF